MTTTRFHQKSLTAAERELILEAIRQQFAPWVAAAEGNEELLPKIVDQYDDFPAVVWESGAPDTWAIKDAGGDVDEEFGFKLPARPATPGFTLEPYSGYVLSIIRDVA